MKRLLTLSLCWLGCAAWPMVAGEAKCPISGKAADPDVAVNVNGKPVAFCCNNCKGKFEANLNIKDTGPGECQYSGKPASKDSRLLHATTEAVYFCCGRCEKKYTQDQKVAAIKDDGPGKCPYSGKDADPQAFVVHQGKKTYFCCGNCAKKYKKEHHVVLIDQGPKTCPLSGEPADKDRVVYHTKTKAVYFCCEKCAAKYVAQEIASKL